MNNFLEELKKYFEATPQDKILEDWAKSADHDNVGPTIEEFIKNSKYYHVYSNAPNAGCIQPEINNLNPKYSSGFF
ncbi:MAG: hypothetical protein Q8T08_03050 [Ignavibacteria bacterium]|jgi:hypothetical protein|nr:hypothetical protein [Ignavibacteria bacterium]